MTTENVTINLDYKVEIPESVRDDLKKLFGVKDGDVLTSLPYANWPRAVQEALFAGTEAQNEQCCGETGDCVFDEQAPKSLANEIIEWAEANGIRFDAQQEDFLHRAYAGYTAQQEPESAPETCSTPGCDEPVFAVDGHEPGTRLENGIEKTRYLLGDMLIFDPMDDHTAQLLLEADQALEDAQIHIADQAEKARLQAEEDEMVDEWRIAIMKASNVTKHNFTDWDMMAEDTKRMWRERFYGNVEWIASFAKGDK